MPDTARATADAGPRPDEGTLVWAAATVLRADPTEVLTRTDLAALDAVVVAATRTDPVEAAAALLVTTIRERPFPHANVAIAWLAAADLLAAAGRRVAMDAADAVDLCTAITTAQTSTVQLSTAEISTAEVAGALRASLVRAGTACPACGRHVYADQPSARHTMTPGAGRYELTARCAFEHRAHDRRGNDLARPAEAPRPRRHPVLARGACGSYLVVGPDGGIVVSPWTDEPAVVRVARVGDVAPGDLVGSWSRLVAQSRPIGFAPAESAQPDADDLVDLTRLRAALQRPVAGVAAP